MRFTPLLFLLLAGTVCAEDDTWLRNINPNDMYVFAYTDGCPFTGEDLKQEARGVLIRSRMRPVETWNSGETLLYVDVTCLRNNDMHIFNIDILLAKFEHNIDGDVVISHTFANYGKLGQGGRRFTLDAVEEGVEEALTDYLVANFDLGD